MSVFLERQFGLSESGTTVRTEVTARATTFLTGVFVIAAVFAVKFTWL